MGVRDECMHCSAFSRKGGAFDGVEDNDRFRKPISKSVATNEQRYYSTSRLTEQEHRRKRSW